MRSRTLRFTLVAVIAAAVSFPASAAPPRKHVIVDGSRARPVHTIPIFDEQGEQVRPEDNPAMPFSTRMTCGDCHDYDQIGMGRHFNSSSNVSKPGRLGEPWVLMDESTGTQLPLSYRDWPGTWRPGDVGMTHWDFVKQFGHHLPGGDMGEREEATPDPKARWDISGKLEINCLACHNASPDQNQSEWAIQVGRENLRWAATGSSSLGVVEFMASRLPNSYDIFVDGPNKDNSFASVPDVVYDQSRFNKKDFVFFDVTRDPPVNRCYFCHSTISGDLDAKNNYQWDPDVHMTAGLKCTDCHRNSLDHRVARGYEGEENKPEYASLTCEGCHLGKGAQGPESMGGRLGAPRPMHRGFPAIHFEKLTCTACHSGPMPKDKTGHVRTSRANRLGIHGRAQWDTQMPYILSPVFVREDNGKIGPREMIWPAFWGRLKDGKIAPIPLAQVTPIVDALREANRKAIEEAERQKAAQEAKPPEAEKPADEAKSDEAKPEEAKPEEAKPEAPEPAPSEETAPLTEAQIIAVLTQLSSQGEADGKPVYVSGGKVYQDARFGKGTLEASDHPAAQAYSWPFAHDVRPAARSLGSGGCGDCHDDKSPFFYGKVAADSPTGVGAPVEQTMAQLERLDGATLEALDGVAELRTAYIIAGVIAAILLGAALIHYGFMGLEGLFRLLVATGGKK